MTVRLIDVIDTASLLAKYDDIPCEYDGIHNMYVLEDRDFDDLVSRLKNKHYLDKFIVDETTGKSPYTRMSSRSSDLVMSSESTSTSEIVFTTSSLLDLLAQIEELSEYDIDINESIDGSLQLTIGESYYSINLNTAEDVEVSDEVVEEIAEINEENYDNLDVETIDDLEPIESGIVKEALKTLAIGGLVRLGKKYLDSGRA